MTSWTLKKAYVLKCRSIKENLIYEWVFLLLFLITYSWTRSWCLHTWLKKCSNSSHLNTITIVSRLYGYQMVEELLHCIYQALHMALLRRILSLQSSFRPRKFFHLGDTKLPLKQQVHLQWNNLTRKYMKQIQLLNFTSVIISQH